MAIYQVNCPHCMTATMHGADTPEAAEEQHYSSRKHSDLQSETDALTEFLDRRKASNSEFTHGKEHNA